MIISGVVKNGLGGYTALVPVPADASSTTSLSSKASIPARDEKGDPIANYAMVNESNAVWVNETGAQMVAQ